MTTPFDIRARVDFVLVNVPSFDAASGDRPIPALDMRLAELTAQFAMQTFGLGLGELRFAESHDAALAMGTKDFCLIQKVGHMFAGPSDRVAAALGSDLAACAFLTGHIMDRGGYFYFHDQCVLVNRRAWERLGRPALGTPAEGERRAAVPKRSAEDVHDDYTPRFLDPTGEERSWRGAFGYGWSAISESLRQGLRVENWSDATRAWKHNCYAYYGHPTEWQQALADVTAAPVTADEGLRAITQFLATAGARPASRVELFPAPGAYDPPRFRVTAGADVLAAPARGFELHRLAEAFGFHDTTRLVLYADDPVSLDFHRFAQERWDGESLGALVGMARAQLGAASFDFAADETPAAIDAAFRQTMTAAFRTPEGWRAHWQRIRALKHDYIVADPVAAPDAFCDALSPTGTAIVSVGDCFNAFAAIARFDGARRRRAFDRIAARLKTATKRSLLIGEPPLVRIRGV